MRIGSLCSGYGGLEMAAAPFFGGTVAWHTETDWAASVVLKAHHPEVPNHGSIIDLDWSFLERVDLLTMGVPCQPVSAAGRQKVDADPRWLWPYARTALQELQPDLFLFENVRNLISIRNGQVWRNILADMERVGYAVAWLTLGACAIGAPHHRHRVFALGIRHPDPGPAVRLEVQECDARRTALPSPQARDGGNGRGLPAPELAADRRASGRRNLDDAVALLPTPMARDGSTRNEGSAEYWAARNAARGGKGKPLGADGKNGGPNQGVASGDLALSSAVIGDRWGQFAPAVAHWERLTGRPAPDPTEIGPRGGLRLAPALPEWMQGLPAGYLTDHVERVDALRLAGNGVMPHQIWRALEILYGGSR